MNLVSAIKEIEKEIRFKENLHKEEMKDMYVTLEFLKTNNTTCEKCEGKKVVMRRPCAEAELEEVVCNVCNGTGKKTTLK